MTDRRQTLMELEVDIKTIIIKSLPRHRHLYRLAIVVNGRLVAISSSVTFQRAYQAALLRIGLLDYQTLRSNS